MQDDEPPFDYKAMWINLGMQLSVAKQWGVRDVNIYGLEGIMNAIAEKHRLTLNKRVSSWSI